MSIPTTTKAGFLSNIASASRMLLVFLFLGALLGSATPIVWARSAATPWTNEMSFQNLVYGASSTVDVVKVMGVAPDEVIKSQQMYPVIENYYYYDEGGSGTATIFVFENGLLVGLHLKSADNQLMDLTYFLTNNNDRNLNRSLNAGYRGYFLNPRYYSPVQSQTFNTW